MFASAATFFVQSRDAEIATKKEKFRKHDSIPS